MMDYRGYGKSTGEIDSEEDLYRDGSASLKFLIEEKKVPLQNIIFWGESLGTSVATFLAQEVDTKALILEAPFASFTDVVRYHYPFLPVNWMLKYALDNKKRMDDIHIPVLILHSTEDDIIPFSQGQELFEAASEPKTLVELSGGHNDALSHSTEKYFKAVQEFLQGQISFGAIQGAIGKEYCICVYFSLFF
ncbi:lysophospholipase [Candidatus Gracilibacteria bacterium]|nr:lysophospholipase [Candidatus Gracilibacteria bacterium]